MYIVSFLSFDALCMDSPVLIIISKRIKILTRVEDREKISTEVVNYKHLKLIYPYCEYQNFG